MKTQKDDNKNIPADDFDLIRAFQSGDKMAFNALVHRHMDGVFSLCYRFTGDYQEAEDTAQDIFVRVFKALNRFRFKSSFSTWLYRVSVNTCMNRLRSLEYRQRKKDIRLDDVKNRAENDPTAELGYHAETPMTELQRKERIGRIQKAINSLPSKQKALIVLHDIEGLSYQEITRITGTKPGTIKSRLARARVNLREKLGDVL